MHDAALRVNRNVRQHGAIEFSPLQSKTYDSMMRLRGTAVNLPLIFLSWSAFAQQSTDEKGLVMEPAVGFEPTTC